MAERPDEAETYSHLSLVRNGATDLPTGTRLSEETEVWPKPMVEIGGRPILWHIMRSFDHYGFDHFLIALGYKGGYIKRFFSEYPRVGAKPAG